MTCGSQLLDNLAKQAFVHQKPHPDYSAAVIRALSGVYPGAAFKLLIAVGRVMVERIRRSNQKYIDSLLIGSH